MMMLHLTVCDLLLQCETDALVACRKEATNWFFFEVLNPNWTGVARLVPRCPEHALGPANNPAAGLIQVSFEEAIVLQIMDM